MTLHRTSPPPLTLRFIGGTIIALAIGLIAFVLVMNPSINDFGLMALFLVITAFISIVASYGAYKIGWITRSPRIKWTIMGGYALSSLLTFLNVWFIAQLMFASNHDLLLAIVLLMFAGCIAMSFGYFFSEAMTTRLTNVCLTAEKIAQGNLTARTSTTGNDEVAELARTFNQMAIQLEDAARKHRELETMRRDLIAWVSHDLRTPLTSIRAMVEALADGVVEDPATTQRYLRTIQRNIASLSILIDDLFQMAQIDAGGLKLNRAQTSLSDLISDAIESFSERAKQQGVAVSGSAASDLNTTDIDAQLISRVITNLMDNAIRHTANGGSISVRAARNKNEIRVDVCDTGEGIKQEDLLHLFDQFYRGEKSRSRATGGAGLGLAISKGIIEAHGGIMGAENLEQGAKFFFVIPA
jgi:signal transduction histidine kinase